VMIPAYECASYLRETLASVLAQDPGPELMQIEVVDDASTDAPEKVVEELGGGRVAFHRQPRNVGHIANFNTCLERSRGQLVHLLHGDDCVREGFYRTMQQPFTQHPEIGAAPDVRRAAREARPEHALLARPAALARPAHDPRRAPGEDAPALAALAAPRPALAAARSALPASCSAGCSGRVGPGGGIAAAAAALGEGKGQETA